MVRKFIIGFIIDRKFLPAGFPKDTDRFFWVSVQFTPAIDPKTVTALFYVIPILAGKIAFRETEVVNGVQQVSFSHPVIPVNADHSFPEVETPVLVVFELEKGYLLEPEHLAAS
jgi:hypothetical protein